MCIQRALHARVHFTEKKKVANKGYGQLPNQYLQRF